MRFYIPCPNLSNEAKTLDSAFLVSKRGGDFELMLGGDFSVGYSGREGKDLNFFTAESLVFRVWEPRAFIVLRL